MDEAPLDPHEIAEIDDLVSRIVEPEDREPVREMLVREAQAKANNKALNRRRYREGLELALANGHPDPESYAATRAIDLQVVDLHERRLEAIRKRVEDQNRKRRNKHHEGQERASKTARPQKRRLPQRDRQYVDLVGLAEKGGWLRDRPLVLEKIEKKLNTYRLPHWEKTTISLKVMAMSVVSASKDAQTINLRLSPTVCAAALKSKRGAVSYMQDRVRKALERVFLADAPEFWFTIEMDWGGQFHLHGAVITPPVEGGRHLVDKALRDAGGAWASSKGQQYQQFSKPLVEPLYWASYVVKHMNISAQDVGGKLYASTRGIRSAAAERWDSIRNELPQSA